MTSIGLASVMGGKAYAQGTDTIKIAFAARGLRTIDPHKSIQGVDNWAIIAIYDKLVDLQRWKFPATVNDLVPRLATSWKALQIPRPGPSSCVRACNSTRAMAR